MNMKSYMLGYLRVIGAVTLGAALAASTSETLSAQSIERRVSSVLDGRAQLTYTARPGACGDGRNFISLADNQFIGTFNSEWRNGDEWRARCVPGPARVVLTVRDGVVTKVNAYVGPSRADENVSDLGQVSAPDAARYFGDLLRTAPGSVADNSILPLILADSAEVWPQLLAAARDSGTRSRGTRTNATFWLSRFAGAALSGHPNSLSDDGDRSDSDDTDVRGSAIFALSQLRHHEGVDPLIKIARTNQDASLRRKALFWLGQSGDPRALDVFESILRGR
jgi:hypothetical protein